ncbi:MAG: glycosyltransferase family 4 protein [Acidobacteriota bacterium]
MRSLQRVTHIVPALFKAGTGVVGGAERYVLELARHMAERVPTTLMTFGDQSLRERQGNLKIVVLGDAYYVRGQRFNPVALKMFGALKGTGSVVHCHQQHVLASTLMAIQGRLRGVPVFVTDLGGGGWDLSAWFSTDSLYRAHLHISEYSLHQHGHETRANAHVIHGGVDLARFSPGAPKRSDSLLFVGRLLPHKGIDVLIEALPERAKLKIIGGEADPAYHVRLRELAAGKEVEFLGVVEDAQLVEEYRAASCVVLPSVYRDMYGNTTDVPELLGQTLLEAMATATPVIATSVASLPEIVVDGQTGLIVPPNDSYALRTAIERICGSGEYAAAMGARGRERVAANFTWDAVVRRCLELYGRYSGFTTPE